MNSHEVFIHIHQGCFAGTGAIVRLPQCQWSKPDGYGKISQIITTTKHSKAKTMCIFLGIYCRALLVQVIACYWFEVMVLSCKISRHHLTWTPSGSSRVNPSILSYHHIFYCQMPKKWPIKYRVSDALVIAVMGCDRTRWGHFPFVTRIIDFVFTNTMNYKREISKHFSLL